MSEALNLTIETFAKSRNQAATDAMIAALDTGDVDSFNAIIAGLAKRRSKAGHTALLQIWHTLSDDQKAVVEEGRGHMGGALRDALLADKRLFENACVVALRFGEFDLTPTLITIGEHPSNPRAIEAVQVAVNLIANLNVMLHSPRSEDDHCDPEAMRRYVLESLDRSLNRFRKHKRAALVEAFVSLSGATSNTLNTILDDPRHSCFQTVVNTLGKSISPGVIHLIFEFLKCENAHVVVRNIVSKRSDAAFVAALTSFVSTTQNKHVTENLKHIHNYHWLEPLNTLADRFGEERLVAIARLVERSGLKEPEALSFVEAMLKTECQPAKSIACEMLGRFRSQRANHVIVQAMDNPEPKVRATAIRQLLDRSIPDLLTKLMKLIEDPCEIVQEAAREALTEFSFESFLSRYDTLDELTRRNTGSLVSRVDNEVVPKLRAEMESQSRKQRSRAIEMADSLGLLAKVSDALIDRLEDEDHLIRVAAADALQFCTGTDVRDALMAALKDRSTAVQASARASLIYQGVPVAPAAPVQGGVS
ncbi:HEAT repeat domain-containing protein [Adhaeretor mobilis]|uniref:HEAT repeat protein n=1 Tax=Adhaeretor mobilis TaxID=1930276 RepID=A0A517MXQ4_9BACT|nr:HEAT repeat domain-containing protein [Adhaeretor mobilis]QDS99660.1 HEAT repeat protein [Adhaeretor mobilis]